MAGSGPSWLDEALLPAERLGGEEETERLFCCACSMWRNVEEGIGDTSQPPVHSPSLMLAGTSVSMQNVVA